MKGTHQKRFRCLLPTRTSRRSGKHSKGDEASFRPSNQFTQQRGTKKGRGHPRFRSTPCFNCVKIGRKLTSPHDSKGLAAHVPSPFISLTTSLSLLSQPFHGERKAFHAVTVGLSVASPLLPGLMHFLAQHIQVDVAARGHPRKLPILQEKRDLVTRLIQPDDAQRIVAHIVLSRIT